MKLMHEDASAEVLGFCRIIVYGLWLLFFVQHPLPSLDGFPPEWFELWGPFSLLPSNIVHLLLDPWMLWLIYAAAVGLVIALMLGIRPFVPLGYLLCCALAIV